MRRKMMAALLGAALLIQTAACGNPGTPDGGAVDNTESAHKTGEQETKETAEPTALSRMEQVNMKEPDIIEDNCRTYYEVFVYSFYDSDGDGVGDLKGLTEKLDYINDGDPETDTDLGCNGIWLMPVMPSPSYHKYDVIDYKNIDAQYGNLDDFKNLIEECHNRGINVIIDLVMNHTSFEHEWFQTAYQYLQSLPQGAEPDAAECPYVDYYNFSKEKSSGYYPVEGTDWYYEGQFWSGMPDLNWDNETLKTEFEEITDFWLELGADGFRLDAVQEFYTGADEKNIAVLTWYNDMVKEKKTDAYLVGEAWNDSSVYAKYYASGMSFFDFAYANSDGIIADVVKGAKGADFYGKNLVNTQELLGSYNENFIDAPFYTNHDMARSAGYYSGDSSEAQTKMGNAMNLFMSGNAFLYYGEELGMKGSGKDENKRAPMYWSADPDAQGMCDGPQDMDAVKMKYGSYEEQERDGNSIYHFVKEAVALRNSYPSIGRGQTVFDETRSNEKLCVITKTYEDESVTIIFNVSAETQTLSVGQDCAKIGGVLLTGTETAELEGENLTMPAYSVVILEKE